MRKILSVTVMLALVFGAFASAPAQAAKKKKKPKPVETTLFMHGQAPLGEIDGAVWLADGFPEPSQESPMTLDAVEPDGGSSKSMAIGSPVFNSQCTGLPSGFPTFTGPLSGTITGDAKMNVSFQGPGANAVARIWVDIGAFQFCNDEYVEPHAQVEFEAASGEVEIVFEDLDLTASSSIMIEILVVGRAAPTPRLQYDSTGAPSSFTFGCIPASGTSCVPS